MFEVAQAPVNKPGRPARGSAAEIGGFDEGGAQAAEGGVASDPGAGDPAADDQNVERLASEPPQRFGARGWH
jgi:hypothetical protein